MLTKDEFDAIEPGDLFDVGPLFEGLDKEEQVTLVAGMCTPSVKAFTATYCGVYLGTWTAEVGEGEKVNWHIT